MESISQLWENVKERVSNPFIFSFVVLLVIFNWKITVGILILDGNEIRLAGHLTLVDYIEGQLKDAAIRPAFWGALVYCFAIPLIKEVIRWFQAGVNKYGSIIYFKISDESKVPFDQYMEQIRSNEKKTKEIDTLLDNTRQRDADRQKASVELDQLKVQYETQGDQLVRQRTIVAKMRDPKVFDGIWRVNSMSRYGPRDYEVSVNNGTYTTPHFATRMNDFFFDAQNQQMAFNTQYSTPSDGIIVSLYVLTFDNKEVATGKEGNQSIKYTFISPLLEGYQLKDHSAPEALIIKRPNSNNS